jgi:hypothetical protein
MEPSLSLLMSPQCPHNGCDPDFAGKTANVIGAAGDLGRAGVRQLLERTLPT